MSYSKVNRWLAILLILLSLDGCVEATRQTGARQGVERYLKSLVERDRSLLASSSCADWEAQANVEFDSFAAVKLELKDLTCQETGQASPYSLVSCSGSIVANYGAEQLEIDVADRTYLAIEEGGDWRMCGYHQQ